MKTSVYKRFTRALISPGSVARPGIRKAMRTQRDLNIFHAIIGVKSETGELLLGLKPYILGHQLTEEMVVNAREEMGDIGFYLVLLARELKVKVSMFTKRPRCKGTPTEAILALDAEATALLDCAKKAFYGREIDLKQVAHHVDAALGQWWRVSLLLFGEAPEWIVEANVAKLSTRYPDKAFNALHESQRDVKKEAEAVQLI